MSNWFEKHSNTLIPVATIILAFGALVAVIDRRLDAQDQLISQRFDAQDRSIEQRFEAQERYIEQRFDAVEQRFEAIDQRFEAMDKRLDHLAEEVAELRKLLVGINERVSRNEGRIDVILKQIQAADALAP